MYMYVLCEEGSCSYHLNLVKFRAFKGIDTPAIIKFHFVGASCPTNIEQDRDMLRAAPCAINPPKLRMAHWNWFWWANWPTDIGLDGPCLPSLKLQVKFHTKWRTSGPLFKIFVSLFCYHFPTICLNGPFDTLAKNLSMSLPLFVCSCYILPLMLPSRLREDKCV